MPGASLIAIVVLLVSYSVVLAIPTSSAGYRLALNRRISRSPNATDFDASVTAASLKRVLNKYQNSDAILQGIGINLDNDIADTLNTSDAAVMRREQTSFPPIIPIGPWFLDDFIQEGMDVLYYGNIDFGTPKPGTDAQLLSVDVDTGSADLWVPSDCVNCPNRQFDPSRSSTFKSDGDSFSIGYGSGSARGQLCEDRVSLGGFAIDDQTFALVNEQSEDFWEFPSDGLIGLAFGTISQSKSPTPIENLIKQEKIKPFFSMHMTRGQAQGSELCVGCYDETKAIGGIRWVPVRSRTYWTVGMDSASINANSIDFGSKTLAVIDSGTTLIYFPDSFAEKFYANIPGAERYTGTDYWTFPCSISETLNISFSFGYQGFSMKPSDFNLGHVDDNNCVGGILSLQKDSGLAENMIIIGDIFLKSWYTVYSYEQKGRVGFSPSINNE